MKNNTLLACFASLSIIFASPALVLAQSAKPAVKKSVVKKPSTKPASKKAMPKKVFSNGFAPQSEATKALAEQFNGGRFNCEFDNYLTIVPNKDHPGYFTLTHKGMVANMLPVPTNTGALRLEGKATGLVWLQLPTKSMLMNNKLGQRVADECHAAN